jgi:hypothetical protein
MQPPKSAPGPERLTQFAFGFAPPLLLQTAVELQIFDLIDGSPTSLEELSSKTGASFRGLRALLNALVGFEFLRKDDAGRYALTPESEAFLVRNKPAFRGDFFTFVPGMIEHWLNLKEVVKSGEPVVTINSEREGAKFFREFVKSPVQHQLCPGHGPRDRAQKKTRNWQHSGFGNRFRSLGDRTGRTLPGSSGDSGRFPSCFGGHQRHSREARSGGPVSFCRR